jgi:hypothetical protein
MEGLKAAGCVSTSPTTLQAAAAAAPSQPLQQLQAVCRVNKPSSAAASGGLTPLEVKELMDLMVEKGVRVHTDVVEMVMASLEQALPT